LEKETRSSGATKKKISRTFHINGKDFFKSREDCSSTKKSEIRKTSLEMVEGGRKKRYFKRGNLLIGGWGGNVASARKR